MGWTSRSEGIACCPGALGPLRDVETVARLIVGKVDEPDFEPIRRSELFPNGADFSNICGDSDGLSVARNSALSNEAVKIMSVAQANQRPGRNARGAIVANVQDLRDVRIQNLPLQLIFIYDDAKKSDTTHAVVRCLESIDRPSQEQIRIEVRECFNVVIGM